MIAADVGSSACVQRKRGKSAVQKQQCRAFVTPRSEAAPPEYACHVRVRAVVLHESRRAMREVFRARCAMRPSLPQQEAIYARDKDAYHRGDLRRCAREAERSPRGGDIAHAMRKSTLMIWAARRCSLLCKRASRVQPPRLGGHDIVMRDYRRHGRVAACVSHHMRRGV